MKTFGKVNESVCLGQKAKEEIQGFRQAVFQGCCAIPWSVAGFHTMETPFFNTLGVPHAAAKATVPGRRDHGHVFPRRSSGGANVSLRSPDLKNDSSMDLLLAITGFATSIDAMVVGVGLAFLDVDILQVALAIGMTILCEHLSVAA